MEQPEIQSPGQLRNLYELLVFQEHPVDTDHHSSTFFFGFKHFGLHVQKFLCWNLVNLKY